MPGNNILPLIAVSDDNNPRFEAQTRIMNVVEVIARSGPLSAKDIQRQISIAPATLTRILRDLVVLGWVVKTNGHPNYLISYHLESLIGESQAQLEEHAEFVDIIDWIVAHKFFFFEFGCFTRIGKFEVIEDSRKGDDALGELSLGYDALALTAQKILDPQRLLRHYKRYFERSSHQETAWMTSPEFLQEVRDGNSIDIEWEKDGQGFSIAALASNGNAVGFRVYLKSQHSQKKEELIGFAQDLREELRKRSASVKAEISAGH